MPSISLTKKTKTEILEEYNKLLAQYEDLKMMGQVVTDPGNITLVDEAKTISLDTLAKGASELRASLNDGTTQFMDRLSQEAKKLQELQQAIEISKKNLELHYHIQVGAETLSRLVEENKKKTLEFEEELQMKRRDAERQDEEQKYASDLKRRREEEEFQAERSKQMQELSDRELMIKNQESEIQALREKVEDAPRILETALNQKEQEVTRRLKAEFDQERSLLKKEWESQRALMEQHVKNLETKLKQQDAEMMLLRQEAERANKKAQELAVKVIEHSRPVIPPVEAKA